jgi:hypothetical protein
MKKNTRLFMRVSAEQKARIEKAAVGRKSVAAFLLSSAELRLRWGSVLRAVGAAEDRGFKKSAITASITRALAQL